MAECVDVSTEVCGKEETRAVANVIALTVRDTPKLWLNTQAHNTHTLQGTEQRCLPMRHLLPFLWIQVTEGDSVEGVVSSKEEPVTKISEGQSECGSDSFVTPATTPATSCTSATPHHRVHHRFTKPLLMNKMAGDPHTRT